MTQPALRLAVVDDDTTLPVTNDSQRRLARIWGMVDAPFERVVLLTLFVIFLTGVGGIAIGMHAIATMNRFDAVITEVSTTTAGNRVVSCTDLSLQAPAVAASLPQCSGTSTTGR